MLALGIVGFARVEAAAGRPFHVLDDVYLAIQLFVLQSGAVPAPPWELEVARFLAPAIAGYTAIAALAVLFREQIQRLRTRRLEGHVVVCGLGRKGVLLARSLLERGDRVVAIECDAQNDEIEAIRAKGAVVLVGDGRDVDALRRAGVARAGHVVAVTGDDGANAEVSVRTRQVVPAGRRPLPCLVHVVDPQLCTLLRMQEIGRGGGDPVRVDFFNVFEIGARELLTEYPPFGEGRPRHVVIVGLGRMGERVLVHAARMWRASGAGGEPPVVTVVDRVAGRKVETLGVRVPGLGSVVRVEPCEVTIGSPEFERASFLVGPAGTPDVSAVYVCVDDDSLGMSAALSLHRRLRGSDVPVVVRMVHDAGLASLLHGRAAAHDGFETLHAFGLLDRTCSADLLLLGTNEVLARAMHEEYRRTRTGEAADPARNPSMAPWVDLPQTLRDSNRDQAAGIGEKLEALGYDLSPLEGWEERPFRFSREEVEVLGRMEHERWVEERLRGGWVYGPGPKDVERRTSPYLVPWEQLPAAVREDDRIFVRRLPVFLADVGFRIVRVRPAGAARDPGSQGTPMVGPPARPAGAAAP